MRQTYLLESDRSVVFQTHLVLKLVNLIADIFFFLREIEGEEIFVVFFFVCVASVVVYICLVLLSIDEDIEFEDIQLLVHTAIIVDQTIDASSVSTSKHTNGGTQKYDTIGADLLNTKLTCEIKQYPKPIPYNQDGMLSYYIFFNRKCL